MRAVVQRVESARLDLVEDGVRTQRCEIGHGLVVLAGIEAPDTDAELKWVSQKIAHLRIFEDDAGKMNRSVLDAGGSVLLVPNFTVAGRAKKGRRPSFDTAMPPADAASRFPQLAELLRSELAGAALETGVFGADMRVSLTNDGPITIWLDSEERA